MKKRIKKRPSLQKQCDEITTTTMLPPLPKIEEAKKAMADFEMTLFPTTTTTFDFGPMLDFAGVMSIILGLLCMGFAIGLMK